LREPGGQLTLEVADNGTGIPADLHSEVFSEMFSTKGARGTGLGLLVVYRVATAHRGEISVLSDDGFGTVFTVIFPPPADVASIDMCS
jgi:signal transduction histidine kinase